MLYEHLETPSSINGTKLFSRACVSGFVPSEESFCSFVCSSPTNLDASCGSRLCNAQDGCEDYFDVQHMNSSHDLTSARHQIEAWGALAAKLQIGEIGKWRHNREE